MTENRSRIDEKILNLIQQHFPIESDPYARISETVGISREETHQVVQRLRDRGIIRRVGGSFSAQGVGYVSSLIASKVRADHLVSVAEKISEYAEVTHCYERSNRYNLWFTIIAETPDRMTDILDAVAAYPGVDAVVSLPALKTFKIRVEFKFDEKKK